MINITDASAALKTLYLGVLAEQLNTKINPLLAKIQQTSNDVYGKEIKKLATYGINGGIGSGTEIGNLPLATGNQYAQFVLTLKNFYGKIEISDKAIRASQDNSGAFVNLLNAEMEGLVKASKFNFGRMLFGDGSGKIATVMDYTGNTNFSKIKVDSTKKLCVGMAIDIEANGSIPPANRSKVITSVDTKNNIITINSTPNTAYSKDSIIYVQGSKDNELTGLEAVFGDSELLYGLSRGEYSFLSPYHNTDGGDISSALIQDAIDTVEESSGGDINFIVTSYDVRKKYVEYCTSFNKNIDVMNLDGGFKALSYSGIPVVVDRFCDNGCMYLLNTDDFKLYQLCDWRWLESESGSVLRQNSNSATYNATLVKYADMLCYRPLGQAKISNIG